MFLCNTCAPKADVCGVEIVIEYMPPSIAGVAEQNAVLEKAAASLPSGIAVDPVDVVGHMTAINHIRDWGIPVVLFDSHRRRPASPALATTFLMLWQASLGVLLPQAIDTGIDVITQENVDKYLGDTLKI